MIYRQLVLDKKRKIIRNGILNDNFQYEEQALIWRGIDHEKLIGQTIRDALKKNTQIHMSHMKSYSTSQKKLSTTGVSTVPRSNVRTHMPHVK